MAARKGGTLSGLAVGAALLAVAAGPAEARVIFEVTSPYHHIRVVDQDGFRVMSFDGSTETRMSLRNPLAGHFEYIEFFYMPWLWEAQMTNVLLLGLGGGSIQRGYQHYFPTVHLDTVEIDPAVLLAAQKYFSVRETPRHRIHISDARVHLRTHDKIYDAIIIDAYVKNRYGSFIPYHLATREFFELARARLTTNGVVAYNVMGSLQGWRGDIIAAVYQTMKSVFPAVYLFPARDSYNIVMVATRAPGKVTLNSLQQRAAALARERPLPPGFHARLQSFRDTPPPGSLAAPLLTDDFAPVDGLLSRGRKGLRETPNPKRQTPEKPQTPGVASPK